LPVNGWADCFGRVCRPRKINTAGKTTHIAMTQTETINESTGMGLAACDGGGMPARLL
jgi:hypothetical protein